MILYIEDELLISELIMEELIELGAKCIHTANYFDAVEKAAVEKYDVIITDIMIEQGSGEDLVNLIKNDKGHINFNTSIIITSAHVTEGINKLNSTQVVASVLKKPHSMKDLLHLITVFTD